MKDIPELHEEKNFLGKISSWLIDRYRVVYLMIIMIVGVGLYSYMEMPKESIPDIEINYIFVTTAYPGASVQDVEGLVTDPVEEAVEGIEGLNKVTSTSNANYSQVVLEFDEDTDMKQAKLDVQTSVNDIRFEEGVSDPYVIQMETGEMPIMNLTLTGDYDLVQINDYAEALQASFEKIDGVKNVDVSGSKEREIHVSVDQNLLYEYGLSLNSISSALSNTTIQMPLGSTALDQTDYTLRVDESAETLTELENIIVSSGQNGYVYLSDVATITDSYKTPDSESYTYSKLHSEEKKATPVINMSLFRETGADIISISEDVKKIIADEAGSMYPSDLNVIITSDESDEVSENIDTVLTSALGGLLVVIAVLFVFIGLNESIIVAMVIPMSLLISAIVMHLSGITINTISLVAFIVALGLLVDNAIVIMENIDRFRDKGLDRVTASKIGTNQVAPAVLAATITTVGAFIPLAMQGGMMGQFISILPLTLIITILASFFVSIAITPNLSAKLLSKYKKKDQKHSNFRDILSVLLVFVLTLVAFTDDFSVTGYTIVFALLFTLLMVVKIVIRRRKKDGIEENAFISKYVGWLQQFFDSRIKRWMIFVVAFIILVAAVMTIPLGILEMELMPAEEPSSASISITAPEGYLLSDTYKIAHEIEKELYQYEDIESFDMNIGGNKKNTASITVNFVDADDRVVSGYDMVDSIRDMTKQIPGASIDVKGQSSMSMMTNGSDVSVSVQGDDFNQLNAVANQYLSVLKNIEGVDNPTLSSENGVKEITVEIDSNRAAYYGLNSAMIANDLRQRVSGLTVGSYKEAGENYDITVYFDEQPINSVSDFEKIFFTNTMGQKIAFSEVASLSYSEGMAKIEHSEGQKVITVAANVQNGYNPTVIGQEFNSAISGIELPEGVELSSGGQFRDTQEQFDTMLTSFMIAIMIVYTVLVIQFNSFQQPLVILMSVPLALIGVITGLIITGNNLGVYAMMGIVALVGIAVNDAIVLVDFANYQRSVGMKLRDAVSEAVKVRFLPVFATSLTTMGGVLPLALYNDQFSQLGYAIIFGLIASTVLTLLIIPVMYFMMESRAEKKQARRELKKMQLESEVKTIV
ncbi:efflux RND transporter permease subunit [Acidaminobacter sp. JC074]|uniref:efflux RND transporter permease subunit n=1 Tax=Acidaminobacter sp. JC074 TaxID=2530199 RepID=UPI001F117C91|nr:efflux RND transporter permease subunit [Acidaminobacter sp. JC074]